MLGISGILFFGILCCPASAVDSSICGLVTQWVSGSLWYILKFNLAPFSCPHSKMVGMKSLIRQDIKIKIIIRAIISWDFPQMWIPNDSNACVAVGLDADDAGGWYYGIGESLHPNQSSLFPFLFKHLIVIATIMIITIINPLHPNESTYPSPFTKSTHPEQNNSYLIIIKSHLVCMTSVRGIWACIYRDLRFGLKMMAPTLTKSLGMVVEITRFFAKMFWKYESVKFLDARC